MAIVMQKPINNAKTRLKNWLSSNERVNLVHSMLFDVINTLSKVPSIDVLCLVTSDPQALDIAKQFGIHIFSDKEANGMNNAIKFVVDALPIDVQQLLIFPADIPLISEDEIDNIVKMARNTPVTIIPCRKGTGTNGLILSPPKVIKTAFGMNSKENHCLMAMEARVNYSVVHSYSLSCDIDCY